MSRISLAFVAALFLLAACNQESPVGANLLGDETIDVTFIDSIEVSAVSLYDDPSVTFRNGGLFNDRTYLLGSLNDPALGKSFSSLYVSPGLLSVFPSMRRIDSVVMSLPLDTLGFYGDTTQMHNISVHRLIDPFRVEGSGDTLFSDMCDFEVEMDPLGSVQQAFFPRKDVSFFNPEADSIVPGPPQIRIPLESPIWDEIRADTSFQASDTALINFAKGFRITSEGADNSMLGIDLTDRSSQSYLQWYYVDTANMSRVYLMDVGRFRHNCFEHDRSGSDVEAAINAATDAENNYLQSMGGVITEYDLSNVRSLDSDRLINSAVLEIFAENGPDGYAPGNIILASYIDENGDEVFIEDIAAGGSNPNFLFDGSIRPIVVNGQTIQKYNLLLTAHVISLVRGKIENPKLRVRLVPSGGTGQRPTRTVLYSPTHPEFPVKLKLTLSKP